ncbi:hypothetical protein D3C81_2320570 [compost metagenome]
MVFEQGQRNHQRDDPLLVLVDDVLQLGLVLLRQCVLEVATEVLQYVAMGAAAGAAT